MNSDEMAEELAGFNMAHTRIHSRADELIACLEGEIAKRDETIARLEPQLNRAIQANYDLREELAACRIAVENCDLFLARIAELEDDLKCAHSMLCEVSKSGMVLRAELAALKAQGVVMPELRDFEEWWCSTPILRESKRTLAEKAWIVARLNAAPAAPAADAGLVDMYRHLQTVTPYRFKKIQDASVTDGGDVLYFHKDRFDAALLDDMAANCAKGSK